MDSIACFHAGSAGDPSSTAALVHMWAPVLVAIPIGFALFLGWGARRIRQALHRV